jgi:hypothetical protein
LLLCFCPSRFDRIGQGLVRPSTRVGPSAPTFGMGVPLVASDEVTSYLHSVHEASQDAGRLEVLYREAASDDKADFFAEAMRTAHEQRPEELLFAA